MNTQRQYLGSPSFRYENSGTIASGAVDVFDFAARASASEKYAPFNLITITNQSGQSIRFFPNQDSNNGILIPNGVIRSLDKKSVPALWSFRIENVGSGTASAESITVEVQREVIDGETIVQLGARKIFGRGGI